jgi:hypothetical protein
MGARNSSTRTNRSRISRLAGVRFRQAVASENHIRTYQAVRAASGGVAKEKTPGGYFEILVFLDAERCRNRSLPKLRKSDRIKFRWLKNPR